MTGNKDTLTALAFAALMVSAAFAGGLVQPVSAQDSEDDSVVDTLFSSDSDSPGWETARAFASGLYQKYNPLAEQPEKAGAETYADRVQSTFNENRTVIQNWVNPRSSYSSEYDVIRFQFEDKSGNTEWLFLVSDKEINTQNWTDSRMMNLTQFKQTGREVDKTYHLSPYASRNANSELETFITEYAKSGEDVNRSYLATMAGKYRGEISGEDLPGGDD